MADLGKWREIRYKI